MTGFRISDAAPLLAHAGGDHRSVCLGGETRSQVRELMARYPSKRGWRRIFSKSCGSAHQTGSPCEKLVIWHRMRELVDNKGQALDVSVDPVLWVAEAVPALLCCPGWFYLLNVGPVGALIGTPWAFSGPPGPGTTMRLAVANGTWLWVLSGDRDGCCGGWLARWPD